MPTELPMDGSAAMAPPGLTFLFDKPDGKRLDVVTRCAKAVLGEDAIISGFDGTMAPTASAEGIFCRIKAGGHSLELIEIAAPAPGLDEMIQFTRMDNASLASLQSQTSHILCFYKGEEKDPVEIMLVLFRFGAALLPHGMLGAIHGDGWQCFPPQAFTAMQDPAVVAQYRGGGAPLMLCNRIPFRSPEGTWWASKGNHVFGVPDFAFWDDRTIGVETVNTLFLSLFEYIRQGAIVRPGETMEMAGLQLVVGEVTEYRDFIAGPGQTLALRMAAAKGQVGDAARPQPGGSQVDGAPPRISFGCVLLPVIFGGLCLAMYFESQAPVSKLCSLIGAISMGVLVVLGLIIFIKGELGRPAMHDRRRNAIARPGPAKRGPPPRQGRKG